MSDLAKRLRIKAGMIEMGERIAWGSDSALMREAADALDHAAVERKKVGRPQIREVFLRNGAVIPADRDDLPDYVYESVFELLEMAAPAVQGEPVGWSGWGCQYPGKMPRLYGERRIAELNCDWENGDQLLSFTAAPQPAEQQPSAGDSLTSVPDEVFAAEFNAWWEQHGQFCRAGGGDYERTFAFEAWRHLFPQLMNLQMAAAEQQPAPDVAGLVEALEQILGWRELRSGQEFPIERIEDIARNALAAHREQGGK